MRRDSLVILLSAVVWGCLVAAGLGLLWGHAVSPGDAGSPPGHWPADSSLRRDEDRPTLLLFAHPQCPCTPASLGELAVIQARRPERARVLVVFLTPAGEAEDWEQTYCWQSATAIPGAAVVADPGGVESSRFRVATSGHVLLYDAGGRLRFSGGITAARGHAGDNGGRETVLELLAGGTAEGLTPPVFGCPLCENSPEPNNKPRGSVCSPKSRPR